MESQPRTRPSRGNSREYTKPLREKGKGKEHSNRRAPKSAQEEKHVPTAQEVSEGTLKRLHILGRQKFGSSPFSVHFDRWLANVEAVLWEFESNPNISVDSQFTGERIQTISIIKQQLERRRREEVLAIGDAGQLSERRNVLQQIKTEYALSTRELRRQKSRELRRLYSAIEHLKREQDEVVRIKTGFFRGISRKDRDQKEADIAQQLADKQRELELVILEFNAVQEKRLDAYKRQSEPVFEQLKGLQRKVEEAETDGSLEERWFACEALIDAVNTFLQRKATQKE
jgi:hypothetical protein